MDTVGFVLVSQVYRTVHHSCGAPGCGTPNICSIPERPRCQAVCVQDPKLLGQHPGCQEWQRRYEFWVDAHYTQELNGGTRLGPLHYFSDCQWVKKPRNARPDARIVEVDAETASALRLPICKECAAKMAPFENQVGVLSANASNVATTQR